MPSEMGKPLWPRLRTWGARIGYAASPPAFRAAVGEVVVQVVAAGDAGAAAESREVADEATGDGQRGPDRQPAGGEKERVDDQAQPDGAGWHARADVAA